jgi:hypothetical protein
MVSEKPGFVVSEARSDKTWFLICKNDASNLIYEVLFYSTATLSPCGRCRDAALWVKPQNPLEPADFLSNKRIFSRIPAPNY